MGYAIACTSKNRQAYGWQRNGGIAPYILCDEKDLIALPDELTYKDGASVSCGFGTVYEAIEKSASAVMMRCWLSVSVQLVWPH